MRTQQRCRTCEDCAYFSADRDEVEAKIPGLTSLSSAYGATLGESRLCSLFDRFVSPRDACASHRPSVPSTTCAILVNVAA